MKCNLFFLSLSLWFYVTTSSFKKQFTFKRTQFLKSLIISQIGFATVQQPFITPSPMSPTIHSYVHAADTYDTFNFNDVNRLKRGLNELNFLLKNWKEKTLFCNFGEFQTDLLTSDNKDKLLKVAAETPFFDYDKSKTMIVKCRADPQMVRAYLGLMPDNLTLNNIEKLMKKPSTLQLLADPDAVDEYFEQVDKYTIALTSADSLSYQARTDYASTETTLKDDSDGRTSGGGKVSFLDQSKDSVQKCRDALDRIVTLLNL